ncbi:uncharacterized protein BBA_05203 [Beauveria bassiana ARSEF 2860]|uniref:Uncharacterized protein n=1 Tax=Beauveria bassiana (strain ARSEF 2860) TaxID=655819 RepID=J4UM36_BEAB2|nr:uncharacterized protein BBA_05203 [Beauveria bassiana ARSEF 2860]EJP65792.1 hypothetical protein BBA_05203 [Beauveria bassiana ARSEF 2860]
MDPPPKNIVKLETGTGSQPAGTVLGDRSTAAGQNSSCRVLNLMFLPLFKLDTPNLEYRVEGLEDDYRPHPEFELNATITVTKVYSGDENVRNDHPVNRIFDLVDGPSTEVYKLHIAPKLPGSSARLALSMCNLGEIRFP